MRLKASQKPFSGPYFLKASSAYWEQEGVNLHVGGLRGEMQTW